MESLGSDTNVRMLALFDNEEVCGSVCALNVVVVFLQTHTLKTKYIRV